MSQRSMDCLEAEEKGGSQVDETRSCIVDQTEDVAPLCPVGACENSPAIHRWGNGQRKNVLVP